MFDIVRGLLVLAVLLCGGALLAAPFGVRVWHPGFFRALLGLGSLIWLAHVRQMWNPVNWGGAIDHTGSWPGLVLFTGISLTLGLGVFGVAVWLTGRLPLVAAVIPLPFVLAYRWLLIKLLYWRAPADFYVEDDPSGMWLFLLTSVLTGCLVLYALLSFVQPTTSARAARSA
jgi:hypothetical protein